MNKKLIYFLVVVFVIFDQLTKFRFEGIRNYKAAFGINFSLSLIIIVSLCVILISLYYLKNSEERFIVYGLMFVLSGSIGNLIDRIFLGYVRDFIFVWVIPTFNIADVFNLFGVVLLLGSVVQDSFHKH